MARVSRIVLLSACLAGCLLAAPGVAWAVTLDQVTSPSKDQTPTFKGTASTDVTDATTVSIVISNGTTINNVPVSAGTFSVTSPQLPANGTFTAHAEQAKADASSTASSAPITFTIDNTAPTANITGGPSGTVGSGSATFTFDSNEPGSTFQCKMDGANNKTGAAACSGSGATYTVGAGSHTFRVWATDGLGNAQGAATARTFTVDTGAPS